MRIAFISNHPAPYRDPFLGRLVRRTDVEVDVFSLFSEDEAHHFWKLDSPVYRNVVLVNEPWPPKWKTFLKLIRMFVFGRYDCVCWPGFLLDYLIYCMLIQAVLGKKYIVCADTVVQKSLGGISFYIKKFLCKHASMIFVPGKASKEYFSNLLAVPSEKICIGAYALDGRAIEKKICDFRKEKSVIRRRYGISSGDNVFLMVANMIKTRYYPITTSAFINVAKTHRDIKFIVVGVGPDLELMQKIAAEHTEVKVIPGTSFENMLELYAIADVYVHGGTEPASTALVIGAISKLPLLSSRAVGCSWDCLEDGHSGCCVADYLSESEWSKGFERMLVNKHLWIEWGERANVLSQALDVEPTVEEFCSLIKK